MIKGLLKAIVICALLSGCESGKAEREYLKGVRSDYDAVRAAVTELTGRFQQSSESLDQMVQQFDAAEKQLAELEAKAGEAQARRKALAAGVEDDSVIGADRQLEVFYLSIQKRAEETGPLFMFFKQLLKAFARLQASMDMINSSSDNMDALVRALEEMKAAFSGLVLELGAMTVPAGKPGLSEVRQTAIDQFRKSIPIIEDMIIAINKKSSARIESAGKQFENWGTVVENSFEKQMDEQMEKEIAPLDKGWEKILSENTQIGDNLARLEGKFS